MSQAVAALSLRPEAAIRQAVRTRLAVGQYESWSHVEQADAAFVAAMRAAGVLSAADVVEYVEPGDGWLSIFLESEGTTNVYKDGTFETF
jgi:hypothetical protein